MLMITKLWSERELRSGRGTIAGSSWSTDDSGVGHWEAGKLAGSSGDMIPPEAMRCDRPHSAPPSTPDTASSAGSARAVCVLAQPAWLGPLCFPAAMRCAPPADATMW